MTVPQTLFRPVPFPVGSRFGEPRDNAAGFHVGADYPCPSDTPVYAAHDGVVVWTRHGSFNGDTQYGGYGNNVWIEAGDHSFGTVYCHLHVFNVAIGAHVGRGQRIAYVDNTGISTGPHLHFEVRDGLHLAEAQYGRVVDPELYFGEEADEMGMTPAEAAVAKEIYRQFIEHRRKTNARLFALAVRAGYTDQELEDLRAADKTADGRLDDLEADLPP